MDINENSLQNTGAETTRLLKEIQQLEKAKSNFIRISSHQLKSPITIILGYCQILMDDPLVRTNPELMNFASGIIKGAERMGAITDYIRDAVKIGSYPIHIEDTPFPVIPIIQNVYERLLPSIAHRNLNFEIFPLDDLPNIAGDPDALSKVFHHIILNAIQNTPDTRRISIHFKILGKNGSTNGDEKIRISVSDTGIGIAPDHFEDVFCKFHSIETIDTHKSGVNFLDHGPGIGLALAKTIILAHQGEISIQSLGKDIEALHGTTFNIDLPVKQNLPLPENSRKKLG